MDIYNDFFGSYGGRYVAEVLRNPLLELEEAFLAAMADKSFYGDLVRLGKEYVGRPTPLLFAENATREIGGGQIYIKLEGLANTGAHKVNNVIGQALVAKRMGKKRIIAETGAKTLKDAVNEALRDWAASFDSTHYLLGSALGPSPYPDMVREFQSVIGRETEIQMAEAGVTPEALVACVGGGSNAIGFFAPFIENAEPRLVGVQAGGTGGGAGNHASRLSGEGRQGIVHGYKSLFLLDDDGQVLPTHSVSAGLDYPGVGPQLAHLGQTGRIEFTTASDRDALDALRFFARNEGVLFALESAHAGAAALKLASDCPSDRAIVINMSGRGDKDLFIVARELATDSWAEFLRAEVERCEID